MMKFKWVQEPVEFSKTTFLWKYLDLHRFINLLIRNEITFSRLDRFKDPLEGITLKHLARLDSIRSEGNGLVLAGTENQKEGFARLLKKAQQTQKTQYASAWFLAEKESWAMWNLYSNPQSIAIRIKPDHLINDLNHSLAYCENIKPDEIKHCLMGKVDYLPLWPYNGSEIEHREKSKINSFKKDISFAHENEFRFIITLHQNCEQSLIRVNINETRLEVFAHPRMKLWKTENLQILAKKLGKNITISHSSLRI